MQNRAYNHLDCKSLLYEKQFGFQRNNSAEHAILQLTRDITSSFEKREYTLGVSIDLSKAFDTLDHQILIKKLHYYGNDGTALEWFESYLRNRKQYISSQDISKSCLDIICGVPQGSILGPLLFLIYVNDLFKFLVAFIDENLSWKQHIEILSCKISKSLGILYKSRDLLSKQCLKQLYFSFIHSYVNYVNIAWASTSKSKLERLYRYQKHAARVIYHKDWYTHASPLLNDMKALNVFKLNIFNILCFMYKCKKYLNPPVFRNVITHRIKTKYALRNEYSIQEPLCPTNFSQYCISYRGPYL